MTLVIDAAPDDVTRFWRAAGPHRWFKKDAAFDAEIATRFMGVVDAATRGDLDDWAETAEGALALLIVLDQFPRNLFRGSQRAFATDAKARETARLAIANGFDRALEPDHRQFVYLPFMHSESLEDQDLSVALYETLGLEEQLRYAHIHRDVVRRFGRFPHRNAALGRETTTEEAEFLANGGFSA